jgi:hypothetical protein
MIALLVGAVAGALLPGEIKRMRRGAPTGASMSKVNPAVGPS